MSPVRGLRPALAASLASLALVLTLPAPVAGASDGSTRPEPVGGVLLGTRGTLAGSGPGVPGYPGGVTARSFVVADLDSGEVLAARDPHGRYAPASTLKVLTAVALIPELATTALHKASFDEVNIEGSKVGLVPGYRYPVGTLLESLLMVSGNDAAMALAGAYGGVPRTVAQMNLTARRLRAHDTVARNPHGLDAAGQVSSAYDLALVARAGLAMPEFAAYVGKLRSSVGAPGGKRFEIYNHNKLLTRYSGTLGVKNGYTVKSRHSYVGAARRNGRTILVSIMRSQSPYPDATKLLDWGFRATGRATAIGRLVEPVCEGVTEQADRSRDVPVASGDQVSAAGQQRSGSGRTLGSVPVLKVGAVALLGGVIGWRRRVLRRRRFGGPGELRLHLPVR